MIQARGLTKRFGSTLAVDDLSFTVEPGKVTGFLGPNGAGKSTTLHLMLAWTRTAWPGCGSCYAQAAHGRAVLVSSHLLAEMQLLADHVLVIGRGRLLADEPTDRLLGRSLRSHVLVRLPDADRLAELLVGWGATVQRSGADELTVFGIDTRGVGELAHQHRLRLHELASRAASLEAAFLELVDGEVEYLQAGAGRP